MSSAMENREFQFPSKIGEAWKQKEEIEREIKALDKRKKALEKFMKDQLEAEMPQEPDEKGHFVVVRDNVKLTGYYQDYPSYSRAINEVIETLVPKSKRDDAIGVISEHTNRRFNTKLSWVEPEEDWADV